MGQPYPVDVARRCPQTRPADVSHRIEMATGQRFRRLVAPAPQLRSWATGLHINVTDTPVGIAPVERGRVQVVPNRH